MDFIPSESIYQSWTSRPTANRLIMPHGVSGMCMTRISGMPEQRHTCR